MRLIKSRLFKILIVGLVVFLESNTYAKSYHSTLNHWSRSRQLFSTTTMQTKIIWHATYFSPELRRAFIQEHIQKKHLSPLEAARYTAEQDQKGNEGEEFFIGMYTRKPYKNFSLGQESFWEAVLTTQEGQELKPTRIDFVAVTPYEQVMFPYLGRWSQGYRVVFPKTETGKSFTLTMRSVIGQTHLKW